MDVELILGLILLFLLLFCSAAISASEVAMFSLSGAFRSQLVQKSGKSQKILERLLHKPDLLLSTILISNNFVNVAIIVISTYLSTVYIYFPSPYVEFIVQVILITSFILFFGEILPKVLASEYNQKVAVYMALPIYYLSVLFYPISYLLIKSGALVNKVMIVKQDITMDDISAAIDLTEREITDEKSILKGAATFGNIEVKDIMTPRIDLVAVSVKDTFNKVLSVIVESGYSRIPVFENTIDEIKGVLIIKDLLLYIENRDFKWQSLVKPAIFVPETKRINELLRRFQNNKNHMALVVDEYGGLQGVVTMEDILEEIVGEISDESDSEEPIFTKLSEKEYLFEGKVLLHDFARITETDEDIFESKRGDADTLAGLILEMRGEIPHKSEKIDFEGFRFIVESVDKRRIKQIRVIINGIANEK